MGRDQLRSFFQKDFFNVIGTTIEQLSEGMAVSEDFKAFLTNFYTDALASFLINWIREKNHSNKEKMVQYISVTLYGTIEQVLKKAEKGFA